MSVHYCDFCGEEIVPTDYTYTVAFTSVSANPDHPPYTYAKHDICEACLKRLQKAVDSKTLRTEAA